MSAGKTGALGGNLFSVFLFGYFHRVEMKASVTQE